MIEIYNKLAKMKFGTGDIAILGGDTTQSNYGIVSFKNQPPQGVGNKIHVSINTEYNQSNMDVIMTFTDTKSIDVLIEQLLIAKECMEVQDD